MNSADFYLLYLHLANQKAIKNYTLVTKLQNQNRVERRFAKETFTLLAFAGLRKTIAVAEWRNLFGYREAFASHAKFYDLPVLTNEFLLHYKHSYGQKTCKLKALTRFKKTVNPLTLSSASHGRQSFNTGFTLTKELAPSHFSLQKNEEKKSSFISEKTLAYKTKLRETAKTSSLKFLNLFNQRILSQSFKNNFIQNLKNFENPVSGPLPGFYVNEQTKTKLFGEEQVLRRAAATVNRGQANLVKNQLSNVVKLRQGYSREDHQMNMASWAQIIDLREFIPRLAATEEEQPLENLSLGFLPKSKTYGQLFLPLPCEAYQTFLHRKMGSKPAYSQIGVGSFKKGSVETTRVSYLKDSFGSTKKEILLASPALTQFYSASWLLESIRTELSSRNANIKRVLNQTFLLTQQPLFNFPKKQTEKLKTPLRTAYSDGPVGNIGGGFLQPKADLGLDSRPLVREAAVIPYLIKGLRITFSGRLGGKKGMAKTLTKTTGRVPLSTLREKVDFAKGVVQTKMGSLGVKVWICFN
uniref:Ribosomal protein S3 n=1 Tax=Tupiella akineta TaxID=160070 RepID=Q6UVR6_TUPAK|nr:ribosomal protein S3 [Tupiella akineta]AAQ18758.1 ribosomal protein S3 [Tupiella akineta]